MISGRERWRFGAPPTHELITLWDFVKRLEPEILRSILGTYLVGQEAAAFPSLRERILKAVGQPDQPGIHLFRGDMLTADEAREMAALYREIGLEVSARLLDEIAEPKGFPKREQNETIPELARQIKRELDSIYLMVVPGEKVALLRGAAPFGSVVPERFPEVADEIVEASRALAFGLNTSSVFHLMRVVEAGLTELVTTLGVSDYAPSWKGLLAQVDKALKALDGQRKDASARAKIRVISEARLHIAAIKDAWRNPTIHKIAKTYDDRQARRVYEAVRDFMEQLAGDLPR